MHLHIHIIGTFLTYGRTDFRFYKGWKTGWGSYGPHRRETLDFKPGVRLDPRPKFDHGG